MRIQPKENKNAGRNHFNGLISVSTSNMRAGYDKNCPWMKKLQGRLTIKGEGKRYSFLQLRRGGLCRLLILSALFLLMGWQHLNAADATFTWTANTETNLAGYKIHYGTTSRNYDSAVLVPKTENTATVSGLTSGITYYFAATAYDTDNYVNIFNCKQW